MSEVKDEQRDKSSPVREPGLPSIRPRQHCLPKILHSGKTFCLLYTQNSNGFSW